jgi:hypothetical protein
VGVDANGEDDLGVLGVEVDADDNGVDEGALKAFMGWPKGIEKDAFLVLLLLSDAPNLGSE